MINLPVAWLVSVLATIAVVALSSNSRMQPLIRVFFCMFFASLAAIGFLLGLRLSYDMAWPGQLQPLIALVIGPSAYLGFLTLTQENDQAWRKSLAVNAIFLLATQIAVMLPLPFANDIIVLLFGTIYLVRISAFLSRDTDAFVHVPGHAMPLMRSALYATIALLTLMLFGDLAITAAFMFFGDEEVAQLLSGAAGVMAAFCFAVALIVVPQVLQAGVSSRDNRQQQPDPTSDDRQLHAAFEEMMENTRLLSDTNLTLNRVARRLGVPARQVSIAVNRCTQDNFSRYLNGFRIRHAQVLLHETDLPVTEIMLESGFASKSSFNGEFRRVTGQTPSQYRTQRP